MKTYPWLKWLMKKSNPEPPLETPLWLNSWSNGEAFFPQTRRMRRMRKRILDLSEDYAKRVGVDRRQFLASTMGMATTLWVISCSDEEGNPKPGAEGCTIIPQEAKFDESVACSVLSPDHGHLTGLPPGFIFDIQTHHYVDCDPNDPTCWEATNASYKYFFDSTGNPGWRAKTRDLYISTFFLNSDTTMTVLSGLPFYECSDTVTSVCGGPISNQEIAITRDTVNKMSGSLRMLNHVMVTPNTPNPDSDSGAPYVPISVITDKMQEYACTLGVSGWKLYPGYLNGRGYFLDDDMGLAVIEKGLALGVPVFCIHKGLPIGAFFDTEHNSPRDIGVVAKKYPTGKFVVYHSGICAGLSNTYACPEGPYDENETVADADLRGVDQLIRSVRKNGVPPGSNVYGELGTAWYLAFSGGRDNDNATHFLGKLLKYLGEDNVLWGSDSLNTSTPQPQIESLRGFQMTPALVQQYGYPELTDALKAKIFGLNAAKVFGIDPNARKCAIAGEPTAYLKQELDDYYGPRRWAFQRPHGPITRREFLSHRAALDREKLPG